LTLRNSVGWMSGSGVGAFACEYTADPSIAREGQSSLSTAVA